MSYRDNRRRLGYLAHALQRGTPLSPEDCTFLAHGLTRIANGEDANKVWGTKPGVGQKEASLIARQRLSFILHGVACLMQPDPSAQNKQMSLEDACEEAQNEFVKVAKKLFPGADDTQYSVEYLVRAWGDPRNAHMRNPGRSPFDDDWPYEIFEVKDPK